MRSSDSAWSRRCNRRALIIGIVVLLNTTVRAEVPGTAYIFPAGGQIGTTVNVRVGGFYLHDAAPWSMTGPQITLSPRLTQTEKIWFDGPLIRQPASQGKEDYPADYLGEVTVATGAAPGIRRWSARTDQGVTPGLPFVLGRLPELVEQETDGEPIPVGVTLPVTVNGRIFPRQDVDVWTFEAQAGQVVTCGVLSARIGSPLISRLELRGPDGSVLAEDLGSVAGDAFLQITAPQTGRYAVHIHDAEFGGLQHYVYRLTITAGPFVNRVFPLGGRPGETLAVELRGANLATTTAQIQLPENPGEIFWWHPEQFAADGMGIPIDVSPGTVVPEVEAANPQAIAMSGDMETVIEGCIQSAGDVDQFVLDAKPGAPIRVRVRAAPLGSLLDSVLTVTGPNEQIVATADDANGSPDAALTFTPAMEGRYIVSVQDRLAQRGGAEYAYRLHIAMGNEQPVVPFTLKLPADVINMDRGGKTTLRVDVQRFGFNEPIELTCANLPTGVTLTGTTIAQGAAQTNLTFEAAATTKPGLHSLQIIGTAKREAEEFRAVAVLPAQPSEDRREAISLSVNVPTPFKVYARFESKFSPRGSVYVRHYFLDRKGFSGPVEISLADRQNRHLQGVTGPKIVVPAGVDEFDYPLLLAPWMELGRTSRTCLMAVGDVPLEDGSTARVAYSSQEQNDQIIVITGPERMELSLDRNSLRAVPGSTVELGVTLERDSQLTQPTTVELVCPPHMRLATANAVTIPATERTGQLVLQFAAGNWPAINMPLMFRATTRDERGLPVVTETRLEVIAK